MFLGEDPDKLKLGDGLVEIVIKFNDDIFLEVVERIFCIKVSCHKILQRCGNDEVLLSKAVGSLELLQLVFVKVGNGLWLPHTDASLDTAVRWYWQVKGHCVIRAVSKLFFSLPFDFIRLTVITSHQSHSVFDSCSFEIVEAVLDTNCLRIQENAVVQVIVSLILLQLVNNLHGEDTILDSLEVHDAHEDFLVKE